MLTKYIENAMRLAHYELMENGVSFGSIPKCKGAWAEGRTLEECREELRAVLKDWVLLGPQLGHRLPVIEGLNLNRGNRKAAVHAQAHYCAVREMPDSQPSPALRAPSPTCPPKLERRQIGWERAGVRASVSPNSRTSL